MSLVSEYSSRIRYKETLFNLLSLYMWGTWGSGANRPLNRRSGSIQPTCQCVLGHDAEERKKQLFTHFVLNTNISELQWLLTGLDVLLLIKHSHLTHRYFHTVKFLRCKIRHCIYLCAFFLIYPLNYLKGETVMLFHFMYFSLHYNLSSGLNVTCVSSSSR